MNEIEDHPLRYALANELHARPFPTLQAPCHAVYMAIKQPKDAANRDRSADRAHLLELLDRFGAQHPTPDATHFFDDLGPFKLKWEQHTEFVSYTVFVDGVADRPFDKAVFDVFPDDWLARMPGSPITSGVIRVEVMPKQEVIADKLTDWFVPESLCVSSILEGDAIMAGDFRFDSSGHMRFAVFVDPGTGPRRVGRILQRICEIESYKAISMLGLFRARELSGQLGGIDTRLEALTEATTKGSADAEDTLTELLDVSAELESLMAKTSFRFSATNAYSALVAQRIAVLREERYGARQTFSEFMARRFEPSVRTVAAAEARLGSMAARAARAGDLLRTRVDVERQTQNQKLLESMDRRAALQLRLQETVEGLSVVAISYYAVNLAAYLLYPAASAMEISKGWLTAGVTPVVLLAVFLMVRRVRNHLE